MHIEQHPHQDHDQRGVAHTVSGSSAVAPVPRAAVQAALMGLLGMLAQGLIFAAAPHCQAATGTLIGSSEIVWSYIWQLKLLHQPSDGASLLGAALILCSFVLPLAAARPTSTHGPLKARPSDGSLDELEWLTTPTTQEALA